eukprot:TRINITY_DN547_c0_g2_i2.p1 TRINITY_DN547_c0_g2~~TRINITY_DN547_c0_g2_i2.p1  ORF type:complete len:293 (+),score=122.29 TRINITY_DN547_c0_g2_i2:84-962(+)
MGQGQSVAPDVLRHGVGYSDEHVEAFKKDPIITMGQAQMKVSSDKWEELKKAWKVMTGYDDVNEGGILMSHPGLNVLLGYIFCAHNQTLKASLLERLVSGEFSMDDIAEKIAEDDSVNGRRTLAIAQEIVTVFGSIFDVDGDKQLTWEEFVVGVVLLTAGTTQEKSDAIFRSIDTDGDGVLSLTELKQFAEVSLGAAIATMRMSQSRLRISLGTQEITHDADKEVLKGRVWDEVARLLAEADTNHDFELSRDEYQKWVSNRLKKHTAAQSPFIPEVVWRQEEEAAAAASAAQ